MKQKAAFGALLMLFFLAGYAQTNFENKIHPAFRSVIARSTEKNALLKNRAFPFEPQLTEGFAIKNAAPEKRYDCIVYTSDAKALKERGIIVNSVLPGFATAWVTPEQILQMASMAGVSYIDLPEVDHLQNDIAVGSSGASLLHQGRLNNTVYKGKNVIVAIYDSGIDWDHFDFRDPDDTTKSRILRIWDQTLTAGPGEAPPSGYSYGVEYTQTQINNELDGTPANVVRERDINGHGTHVAGTAAGNGSALASRKYTGMAPESDLIIIKGGDGSFPVTRTVDAITYLQALAPTLGKPIVLNMSIGGQMGAHDGTRVHEMAVDNFTSSGPGRVVVISAGNDNRQQLHNRISLAPGASASVSITVPDTTAQDVFRYGMYANDNSAVTAAVTSPDGIILTANAGDFISGGVLSDSFTVSLSNRIDIANNDRYVEFNLTRNGTNTRRPTGTWTLTLTNTSGNALILDGWLFDRNSAFVNTSLVNGDNEYMVSSPGNATSAITVGSYVGKNNWYSNASPGSFTYPAVRQDSISSFSSRGPRRDEVLKPEIAATGEVVASVLSSNTSVTNSLITNPGLYHVLQGTSMASPVVAGAAALLLQLNPGATATQVKALLTSAATKDAFTELPGSTPNTTWGYGKLDVFKAASAAINCLPAERKTYKYDSSTINSQESGVTLTTQRIAVRFTPDISGKLGGVLFHPSATSTAMFVEVRTNKAGNPDSLLGVVNLDSAYVARYAWNYINVSSLNISITNNTDYFIVVGRAAGNSSGWSLRRESIALDNRSLQSTDGGATWANPLFDYKIRSVVYNNGQLSGNIASTNSSVTRNINSSNQFIDNNCALIAQLLPVGATPVSGNVTASVWIEGSVLQFGGGAYGARHYEITPTDAPSGTGRLTMYFKQAEFDAFNAHPLSLSDLPANANDALGKSHLRIGRYPGSSSNATGLPGTYSGEVTVIDPADGDIVWNAEANRWEVTIDVSGSAGYIVQTSPTPLPVIVEYFRGKTQQAANVLTWKIDCSNSSAIFTVERSDNGTQFSNIGDLTGTPVSCRQPFSFTDALPYAGKNYYRIKITESTGRIHYTGIILLQSGRGLLTTLYPTIIPRGSNIQVNYAGVKGSLRINDAAGKQVFMQALTNGVQSVQLPLKTAGIYLYHIKDGNNTVASGKIIVQ